MSWMPFPKAALILATAAFASLVLTGAAEAHAHLPLARFSGIAVSDPTGVVPAIPMKGADAKTLTFMPAAPFKPGVYSVKWHAVTTDTRRTQGAFTFTAR